MLKGDVVGSVGRQSDQERLASIEAEFEAARKAMAAEFARPAGGASLRSKRHARSVDASIRRAAAAGDRVVALEAGSGRDPCSARAAAGTGADRGGAARGSFRS
jgi:hypothetical protein